VISVTQASCPRCYLLHTFRAIRAGATCEGMETVMAAACKRAMLVLVMVPVRIALLIALIALVRHTSARQA